MFTITNEEAEELINNAYKIFNFEWGRILFKVLLEQFHELYEVCIEAGYDFNTEKISEEACRIMMQKLIDITINHY